MMKEGPIGVTSCVENDANERVESLILCWAAPAKLVARYERVGRLSEVGWLIELPYRDYPRTKWGLRFSLAKRYR
jgi:hypothetical protein